MEIKVIDALTLEGSELDIDITIDLPEASAHAAVKEGRGAYVDPANDPANIVAAAEGTGTEGTGTEGTGTEGTGIEGTGTEDTDAGAADSDAIAMQRKAIDTKYKREDLAAAAKALGVEFKYDATKPDIIEAVIAAGKAAEIIQA